MGLGGRIRYYPMSMSALLGCVVFGVAFHLVLVTVEALSYLSVLKSPLYLSSQLFSLFLFNN